MSDLHVQLRELVDALDRPGQPGGVLAVARNGVVDECVAYGYANLEHEVRNTRDTVFYIGSTSKQFVAASIALLEADGLLDADDPIAKYVPEVERLGDIRIHHLIHHTSGIRDKYSLAVIGQLPEELIATDDGTMNLLARQRSLSFPSGSRFMYSNSNYSLLATIVERCSGASLAEFTDERIFGPLGMSATRFRPDPNDVIRGRASGYRLDGTGVWKQAEYTWRALGPGGVVTTAESLARWSQVFTGAALGGLASRLTVTRPLTDGRPNNYAYGVQLGEYDGTAILQHGGGVPGFSAQLIQVPSAGLTIVSLANCTTVGAPALAAKALALALGKPSEASPADPPSEDAGVIDVGSFVDDDDASVVTVEELDCGGYALVFMGQRIPLRPLRTGVWAALTAEVVVDTDGLSLRMGETVMRYRRLAAAEGPGVPDDLEGQYTSPELGVTVTIVRTDAGLEMAWPLGPAKPLAAVDADLFAVHAEPVPFLVRVLRASERVTGLRISVDRALGTVFDRAG